MRVVSLFSGAGGLDLGFEEAGFQIVWANEYDKTIWDTFRFNFPDVRLDTRDITKVPSADIPEADIIIGGPPCQSWSEAGAKRGIADKRGQLFFEYIRILKDKQPRIFLAENVSGILAPRHGEAFEAILNEFRCLNYDVSYQLLNANDFGVPQERQRVVIVGFHKRVGRSYRFPSKLEHKSTLRDAIYDLRDTAVPARPLNYANENLVVPNHEYMIGSFSSIYMSRNRVRSWDEPSFTIQAGGRHAPIHPSAPKMTLVEPNKRKFVPGAEHLYRRLSVRECARIQTFPDTFIFKYGKVADGYKMVGNAVPVRFARELAQAIKRQF